MILLMTISMTTEMIPADVASDLARSTIEMYRRLSTLSLAFVVISSTLARKMFVRASEVLTEIDPNINIQYASTV